jgi:hypothetical protein
LLCVLSRLLELGPPPNQVFLEKRYPPRVLFSEDWGREPEEGKGGDAGEEGCCCCC